MSKLVRDKIPEIIMEDGRKCEYRFVSGSGFDSRLYEKMMEESEEFKQEPCYEEAADMYEVLRALCCRHGLDMDTVVETADKKRAKRGGFTRGIVLEKVEDR